MRELRRALLHDAIDVTMVVGYVRRLNRRRRMGPVGGVVLLLCYVVFVAGA